VPRPAAGPAAEPAIDDAAIVELLGALAYGELSAFDRLADDARLAPTLDGRARMSAMAAVEMGHYRLLAERLETLGVAPPAAMEPFVAALETYHAMTEPETWLEGVVKAFVGDGMAADFYRAVAEYVDEPTRALMSPCARCERGSRRIRRSRAASRSGPGGWSARRSARPSTCWPTGTP
jgi:1,2-phenylacetyl-CoA epoxidase catalytic subunit